MQATTSRPRMEEIEPATVLCRRCGHENRGDVSVCHECRAPLRSASDAQSAVPHPSSANPTSCAAGRYVFQRLLGEGADKRVYLAHDTQLDRDVALALIKTESLDATGIAR